MPSVQKGGHIQVETGLQWVHFFLELRRGNVSWLPQCLPPSLFHLLCTFLLMLSQNNNCNRFAGFMNKKAPMAILCMKHESSHWEQTAHAHHDRPREMQQKPSQKRQYTVYTCMHAFQMFACPASRRGIHWEVETMLYSYPHRGTRFSTGFCSLVSTSAAYPSGFYNPSSLSPNMMHVRTIFDCNWHPCISLSANEFPPNGNLCAVCLGSWVLSQYSGTPCERATYK